MWLPPFKRIIKFDPLFWPLLLVYLLSASTTPSIWAPAPKHRTKIGIMNVFMCFCVSVFVWWAVSTASNQTKCQQCVRKPTSVVAGWVIYVRVHTYIDICSFTDCCCYCANIFFIFSLHYSLFTVTLTIIIIIIALKYIA